MKKETENLRSVVLNKTQEALEEYVSISLSAKVKRAHYYPYFSSKNMVNLDIQLSCKIVNLAITLKFALIMLSACHKFKLLAKTATLTSVDLLIFG